MFTNLHVLIFGKLLYTELFYTNLSSLIHYLNIVFQILSVIRKISLILPTFRNKEKN